MKVFISWSGILSRRAAETLREWLPNVLQVVELWMSAEDIEKGARWSSELESSLQEIRSAKVFQRLQRADREILEEILAFVRDQAKRNPAEILFTPTFSQEEPFTVLLSPGLGKSYILTRMFRSGENVIL